MLIEWLRMKSARNSDCKVLLVSASSRKALAIAYSIRSVLGCKVIGLFTTRTHPYIPSRIFNKRLITRSKRGTHEWVLEVAYVGREYRVDLILPVDFIDVITLSKYRDVLEDLGLRVVVAEYDKVLMASNKSRLSELLRDVCRVPKTFKPMEQHIMPANLGPPIVVKGVSDASRPKYFNSLDYVLRYISKASDVIIQEFFPGIGRGYFTVACNGEPLIEFTHQRIIEYDPIGGASLMSYGPVLDPKLYMIGREVVRKLKWVGPLMVETRWNPESGEYVVLEINPKFWGSIDLPVKLNYQLPAILVAAFIHGKSYARRLAKELIVKSGTHSWVLDGIRYLGKDLTTWLKLFRQALSNVFLSDLAPIDPARTVAQIVKGLSKLPKERKDFTVSLRDDIIKVRMYVREAMNRLRGLRLQDIALILDLDGTLVKLGVDWSTVKDEGIRRGYLTRGESISSCLYRLWLSNHEAYMKFSKMVEEYERKSLNNYEVLISKDIINNLVSLHNRGLNVCVATKQTVNIAREVVKDLLTNTNEILIIGRDSGYGPLKIDMFRACRKVIGCREALVIDDSFTATVNAFREGFITIRVVRNNYEMIKTLRIGMIALPPNNALRLVIKLLNKLK